MVNLINVSPVQGVPPVVVPIFKINPSMLKPASYPDTTQIRPEIQRLLEVVNPRDRIRFEDIKPNQLVWMITGIYGLYQLVGLARYHDHWRNPYTTVINHCLVYKEKHNLVISEDLSFGGKDKLWKCIYYIANDTTITLMGLQFMVKIPSEININSVRDAFEAKFKLGGNNVA